MKKKNILKIVFGIFILIFLLSNTALFDKEYQFRDVNEESKSVKREKNLKTSASVEWVSYPSLNIRYFSPDNTPGIGDNALYSFEVDQDVNYSLNISAYYDSIDNFPGSKGDSQQYHYAASYLMKNGTWLIAAVDHRSVDSKVYMMLGIGSNASDIVWTEVSEINCSFDNFDYNFLDIAGNETGSIRIVYTQSWAEGYFNGTRYFSTDDWGKTWSNGTLIDYDDFNKITFNDISIETYKGNFTCIWGATLNSSFEGYKIIEAHQEPGTDWSSAKNLTALEGENYLPFQPSIIYNRTNDNGSIFIGFNNWTTSSDSNIIIRLNNGIESNAIDDKWLINSISTFPDPRVRFAKSNKTEIFYFLIEGSNGLRNATWGEDLSSRKLDTFQAETFVDFQIFEVDDPKCFTTSALSPSGGFEMGILDCRTPFNVRKYNETVEANRLKSLLFDGKDKNGISRGAQAYSFNLIIPNSGLSEVDTILYVDDVKAKINYDFSDEYLSPFTSAGVNDNFKVNLESEKPGEMSLKIKSDEAIVGKYNVSEDMERFKSPVVCGAGLQRFLFYTAVDSGNLNKLMFSKSTDGGMSWENPKIIKSTPAEDWIEKHAIYEGNNLYLWTGGKLKKYVYTSIDGGESFSETQITSSASIEGVSSDVKCWTSSSQSGKLFINQSNDLGFNWKQFCNISLLGAEDFKIETSAYDPISGNYSFLIVNFTGKDVRFLTISNNGKESTLSDNILSNGLVDSSSFEYQIDLNIHKLSDNSNEWIITTSASFSQDNYMNTQITGNSYLAYRTSNNGISFSDWNNYTEITGDVLNAYYNGLEWDIYFPEEGAACFVNSIPELSGGSVGGDIYKYSIITNSAFLFDNFISLDSNYKGEIVFNGVDSTGNLISDGTYQWLFKHIDRAGFITKEEGTLIIDNNAPILQQDDNLTTPSIPYPNQNVTVKVPIYEINPDKGILYYRNSTGNWIQTEMTLDAADSQNIYFEGLIPAFSDNVKTIYWKAIINDTCGNILTVDNDGRLYSYGRGVFEYVKQAGEIDPTLYDDWTWTYVFTSGTEHIDKVWLRRMVNGEVINDIEISASGEQNNTYSIRVSHELDYSNATYKFMFSTDTGSEQIIEEIVLKKPKIRIEEETEPPSSIDLNEVDSLNVSFVISEYSEYLDYLYIRYQFNDMPKAVKMNLTTSSSGNLSIAASIYRHSFTNFSRNCTKLTYGVVGVDLYGNEIALDKNRTINIIPELPSWQMTTEQQLISPIIALFIGAVSGISYTFIASQKSTEERYNSLIEKDLKVKNFHKEREIGEKLDKITDDLSSSAFLTFLSKKFISLGITAILFSSCYTVGWVLILTLNIGEFAMLAFTGAFLAAVFLWVLISDHSVERILRSKEREMKLKDQLFLIGISLTIFISLLTIFFIGNTIAWWRVRVNQQSYNISGITIPRAMTTVLTTFFSSIFLLTWSTSKEVSKKTKELLEAEEENENPLNIMEKREKAISTIIGNVGKKGIIFIAIIGVTIIFASDLSIYATQGILFIIPFVIGAFITLIVANFLQKKQITETKRVVLDNLTICPYCKEKTSLGGTYCEYCGEKLVHGKRYNDGITCRNCNKVNAVGMKHCKYCGKKLTNMNNPEKENKQNKMKNNSDKLTEIKRLKAEKKSKKEK
jgi:hypothetical protein